MLYRNGIRAPRRGRWKIVLTLAALVCLSGLTILGAGRLQLQPESEPRNPDRQGQPDPGSYASAAGSASSDGPVQVAVVQPQRGGIQRNIVQTGTVTAAESAKLFARVSGYVKSVLTDIGTRVEAGQVMAEIDVPELAQDLRRAQALLKKAEGEARRADARLHVIEADRETARAMLEQAEAEIGRFVAERRLREKELARLQGLSDRGSIEEKLLDEKLSQLEQAQAAEAHARKSAGVARAKLAAIAPQIELADADRATAEAAVQIAEAELQHAEVMVNFKKIVAPFAGVVTSRNCDLGDFVRSAAQGGGAPLFTVAQTDRMRVVVSVPDRMVPFIRPDDPAEVRIDSLYGEVFGGKVSRVSMRQDRQTRSMRVEIDLPNPDGRFVDGMYGSVKIVSAPPSGSVTIPLSSLLTEGKDGEGWVCVVRGGRIEHVPARIGLQRQDRVEVVGGLDSEELVVLKAIPALAEGLLAEAIMAPDLHRGLAGFE